MYHDTPMLWKELLQTGLKDDGWEWDWTSGAGTSTGRSENVRARVVAKSMGVWAADGLPIAAELLAAEMGGRVVVRADARNGDRLREKQVVCKWQGPAPLVLALERPFLNLASYAGGIALRTR